MQTTIVPEQVKTQKIQAGVQVSRLEDKDVIFCIGSALEDFILLYFIIVRNIQLFVDLTSEEDDSTTPSPITKSSSPSPPNAPSKTPSTKDTSSTFGTTSSSFESKPQSSTPSSNDTPSPQPSNPFLDDIIDVPPRPSNPIPLQSHPSLDITHCLSPITPLDHFLDTPSPPSPQPQPQPPLMGYPVYFNMFDYHKTNSDINNDSRTIDVHVDVEQLATISNIVHYLPLGMSGAMHGYSSSDSNV
ncbi:hypothetical protein Tco_0768401 [Tanacetum coccineum]